MKLMSLFTGSANDGQTEAGEADRTAPGDATHGVMMHVTLEAGHAAPLRQALSCDCGGDGWTMRIAPVAGTERVRLSLYLPKPHVERAMSRIGEHAPSAVFDRIVHMPFAPSDAWRDLARVRAGEQIAANRSNGQKITLRSVPSIRDLLTPEQIVLDLELPGRDGLFHWIGERLGGMTGVDARQITLELEGRERMGSTALGNGFAVPHCRLDHLRGAVALYVRSGTALELDPPDGLPVVDAVVLLVPIWATSMHLSLLAETAQLFNEGAFRRRLRDCRSVSEAHACIKAA
ncbi:PTS system nitrogen regulatory IIA component [Paraburkholderia youngii]|uniref:PTS sugar transporter subunit IIA n=1 Tax=Paraburkholderia youngii TaxID=2782701 RepID=UPI003D209697